MIAPMKIWWLTALGCPLNYRFMILAPTEQEARKKTARIRHEGRICPRCTKKGEDEIKHYDFRLEKAG
jgi:hypothetical protein